MSGQQKWFADFTEYNEPKEIHIGKGVMFAKGTGNINIEAFANGKWTKKHLENVLYVPDIGRNLFSLGSALDHGLTQAANTERMEFFRNGHRVAVGVRDGRLYRMLFRVTEPRVALVATAMDTLRLWHERLGHQHNRHVPKVLKGQGIEVKVEEDFCDSCMYGKQHRKPFGHSQNRATSVGELIHADVCGPMEEVSLGGSRYFVLFKDDFSHFRMIYFLKNKSEVKEKLKLCLAYIKKATGKDVKILRTDNGTEFRNQDVKRFLDQTGVVHQTSVAYTPEQNGSAEREMRTVVELARTMIYAKEMEKYFWAEAAHTAVHVLNRTGTSTVAGKSPFELWFGKPANIDHLRIFGSDVFVHVPKEKRQKWDAKSEKGIFVGYGDTQKGYRVYFPNKRTVRVVRDVEFKNESYSMISLTTEEKLKLVTQEHEQALDQENNDKSVGSQNSPGSTDSSYKLRDRRDIRKPAKYANEEFISYFAEYNEPSTYEQAIASEHCKEWMEAMDSEMESLQKNETWILTDLPEDQKTIDNRWVYRVKYNANGDVNRYKARLVVRGFHQRAGIDYQETFSPVVKLDSVRALLSVAASEKLKMTQFDVTTAFLYGYLEEDIFMDQPKGYEDGTKRVCKLQRSLYGLKQAPRCWNKRFKDFLQTFDLSISHADPCLFIRNKGRKLMLAIHVDDGLVVAESQEDIEELLSFLASEFDIKAGKLDLFLGLEICQMDDGSVFVSQEKYAGRVLERFEMCGSNAVAIPMDPNQILSGGQAETVGGKSDELPYREAIGSLMYLAVATRPDIMFAVSRLSQFLTCYTEVHWRAVKRVLRYIQGSISWGILYSGPTETAEAKLEGFSDADFAGDTDTRKSTSGYLFQYSSGAVTWGSKKQSITALSTMEAEYIAASVAIREIMWLKILYSELASVEDCPVLKVDNQSAIKYIKNPVLQSRSKHIDIKYHFAKEKYENGEVDFEYIGTDEQVADIFTKALPAVKFQKFRGLMGMKARELGDR